MLYFLNNSKNISIEDVIGYFLLLVDPSQHNTSHCHVKCNTVVPLPKTHLLAFFSLLPIP